MKKIIILSSLILSISRIACSQTNSMEFGAINSQEINMKTYQADPLAEAVVIFDLGDTRFVDTDEGYDIEFTRIRRVKILSSAGIKFSEVSIPLYHNKDKIEKITSIEACSYNSENGSLKKTAVNPANIYVEKKSANISATKFVFPDVREGTIIEYKYVLRSPFQFQLPTWYFQDRIPTIYSKYTVRMIPFYEYTFLAQGIKKFDSQESHVDTRDRTWGNVIEVYGSNMGSGVKFQDLIHTYVMKNVPAFRDESHITSVEDFIMKINFQEAKFHSPSGGVTDVITTWPLLIQELNKNEHFGKFLNSCQRQAKNILETELPVAGKTDIEKCQIIINYVKSKYSWDGVENGLAIKSPKDLINQKKGNCAEINLLLTALLNSAGIDANPVLLSTRGNGKIKVNYPFLGFFDYVIIMVNLNEKYFLADGSDPYTRYDRIPPKCINDNGLIISKEGEKWVPLNLSYNSVDQKTTYLTIHPEASVVDVMATIQTIEYDSYLYRKNFSDDTVSIKKFLSGFGVDKINKVKTMYFDNMEKPYVISFNASTEPERLQDKIIVSPFLKFALQKNDLIEPVRTYPVDFNYGSTNSFVSIINIPEGYEVRKLPEPLKYDNDLVLINLEYTINGKMINANGTYTFKKAVYMPEEYSRLKNYIDVIVKNFNEPLVMDKV